MNFKKLKVSLLYGLHLENVKIHNGTQTIQSN